MPNTPKPNKFDDKEFVNGWLYALRLQCEAMSNSAKDAMLRGNLTVKADKALYDAFRSLDKAALELRDAENHNVPDK